MVMCFCVSVSCDGWSRGKGKALLIRNSDNLRISTLFSASPSLLRYCCWTQRFLVTSSIHLISFTVIWSEHAQLIRGSPNMDSHEPRYIEKNKTTKVTEARISITCSITTEIHVDQYLYKLVRESYRVVKNCTCEFLFTCRLASVAGRRVLLGTRESFCWRVDASVCVPSAG